MSINIYLYHLFFRWYYIKFIFKENFFFRKVDQLLGEKPVESGGSIFLRIDWDDDDLVSHWDSDKEDACDISEQLNNEPVK